MIPTNIFNTKEVKVQVFILHLHKCPLSPRKNIFSQCQTKLLSFWLFTIALIWSIYFCLNTTHILLNKYWLFRRPSHDRWTAAGGPRWRRRPASPRCWTWPPGALRSARPVWPPCSEPIPTLINLVEINIKVAAAEIVWKSWGMAENWKSLQYVKSLNLYWNW